MRSARFRLLTAWLLALCLLAGLWAGGSHRIAHGSAAAGWHAVAADAGHANHADHADHAPGSAECRLLDQALAQPGIAAAAVLLPIAVAQHELRFACGAQDNARPPSTAYQARAPPRALAEA